MFKEVSRRDLYVIEMYQGDDFLGYIKGGHENGVAKTTTEINESEVFKTAAQAEHRLFRLKKYHSEDFSFRSVECSETTNSTYFDKYDIFKRSKKVRKIYIRVKDKFDPLLEPSFLSEYKKQESELVFATSLNINKAILCTHSYAHALCMKLNAQFSERYQFYKEIYYVAEIRNIKIIRSLENEQH